MVLAKKFAIVMNLGLQVDFANNVNFSPYA